MIVKVPANLSDAAAHECVVSIGMFDGVHRGHRRVLEKLQETGANLSLPAIVVTFDPHPRLVLQPHRSLPMLVSLRRRLSLLEATGNVDRCVLLPFDRLQREQSADDFVQETLIERLRMRALVVGENFVCGRDRVGTVDYLRKLGKRFDFTVHAVKMDMPYGETGTTSSSSETRRLIQAGQVTHATTLLGRPHELECVVSSSLIQDSRCELVLPTGMCIPAAGTYTALLSTHDGLSTQASIQLKSNNDTNDLRCFLYAVNGRLDLKPGTQVIAQFLDTVGSGAASHFGRVMAA